MVKKERWWKLLFSNSTLSPAHGLRRRLPHAKTIPLQLVKLWWLCFSRGANRTSVGPLVLFFVMTNASLQRISTCSNQVVELNIANFLVRFVLDRQTRRWQRQDGNRPVEWPRHGLPPSHQHTDTGPLSVSARHLPTCIPYLFMVKTKWNQVSYHLQLPTYCVKSVTDWNRY